MTKLRRGWTTGACATAAAKAAWTALACGEFPDPVEIALPGGRRVAFALAAERRGADWAEAGVVKDAGDDPDVTHGALILARVRRGAPGSGIAFRAGEGVGTVTRPGLPLAPGEPAINPTPRAMMREAVAEAAPGDVEITVSIPGGAALAEKTLNGRLGIVGGLSVLGTTGVVIPYSCSSWIHSIHRGIDVALASGLTHLVAATGSVSEKAAQALYGLPEPALIDMGDFAGATLKYLRRHPAPRLTLAGGIGKLSKLAAGRLDLHSRAGEVDLEFLATLAPEAAGAGSAAEALLQAPALGPAVARRARETALAVAPHVAIDVVIFDRSGGLVARAGS